MSKKLTIIIPHYNSLDLLKKLMDSIPSKEEIQIILVDDNSTEQVEELREYVVQKEIEFYINDSEQHSAGRCRNIGLKHAVGEWLLFADADDYFADGLYDIISPYFNQGYDMVYFKPTSFRLSDGTLADRHISLCDLADDYLKEVNKKSEMFLRYKWGVPISRIIRRSLVEENDIWFDETRVANDIMFSAQCAFHADKIFVDPNVIYCISKQTGTLNTLQNREDVRTRLKVVIRKYKYLKKRVDKETWRLLDLRGDRYIRVITKYRKDKRDILWAWGYMLCRGIRPCISRSTTPQKVFNKIKRKLGLSKRE